MLYNSLDYDVTSFIDLFIDLIEFCDKFNCSIFYLLSIFYWDDYFPNSLTIQIAGNTFLHVGHSNLTSIHLVKQSLWK